MNAAPNFKRKTIWDAEKLFGSSKILKYQIVRRTAKEQDKN